MKLFSNILPVAASFALLLAACDKKETLPYYNNGTPTTLTASTKSVAAAAADSAKSAMALTWTSPNYASVESTYKYIVQLDTAGGTFANPLSKTVTGVTSVNLTTAFTAKELNSFAISKGLPLAKESGIIARVISSYANNNEKYTSNVVPVKITPYTFAFDVNGSKTGPFSPTIANKNDVLQTLSWAEPNVGAGKYTYKLQYDKAGNNFASAKTVDIGDPTKLEIKGITLNGFAYNSGIAYGATGDLEFRIVATINGNQSFNSAVKKYTVSPIDLIVYLYMPGDYQGWTPATAARLSSFDAVNYEGYVNMSSANGFKITSDPDWNHTNYGGASGTLSTSGGDLKLPAAYYLIKANIPALTWSATAITTWGVIGDATPNGWGASTPLTYDAAKNVWTATITFAGSGAFKFRANDGWDINLGGTGTYLSYGGDNISSPSAGAHEVTLDLSNPQRYTYTVK